MSQLEYYPSFLVAIVVVQKVQISGNATKTPIYLSFIPAGEVKSIPFDLFMPQALICSFISSSSSMYFRSLDNLGTLFWPPSLPLFFIH